MLETTESMNGGNADLTVVKSAVVAEVADVATKRHVPNVTQRERLRWKKHVQPVVGRAWLPAVTK